MLFVYTSGLMFALRFFAGPIVHKISPLGIALRQRFAWVRRIAVAGFRHKRDDVYYRGNRLCARQNVPLADDACGSF